MLIIPAVDIKNGKAVRLWKGDFDKVTEYSDKPEDAARRWQEEGAKFLHVVDLDGAYSGELKNLESINKIAQAINIPFEVGGGIRDKETIKKLIDLGAARVVLGTVAFEDRPLLEEIVREYNDKIIVSVDITGKGTVALKGWIEDAGQQSSLLSFVKVISKIGINRIIYTDIERDGTLAGPQTSKLGTYLSQMRDSGVKMSVIMAGGISSLDDIKQLKSLKVMGLDGVIIGKALYENKFSLKEVINL